MVNFIGFCTILFFLSFSFAITSGPSRLPASIDTDKIGSTQLELAMKERLSRVTEFAILKEEALKLGVKAYLFGGTAATYAHYVYDDLRREAKLEEYDPRLFDYLYSNLYTPNQDLDIVVDGSAEVAVKLEKIMMERAPQFQGIKSAWEVRPLKVARDNKAALLGDGDFALHNTDSHSTGLFEITGKEINPFFDLRDQDKKIPQYIEDILHHELHFYVDKFKHQQTSRFKAGINPEIFSVVRYLVKLFQFDLKMDDRAKVEIERIVREFDPKTLPETYRWLEMYGRKLVYNARDIERAYSVLDELHLRERLAAVHSNEKTGTLSYLLSRKPLPSHPLALNGKTAKELGVDLLLYRSRSKDDEAFVRRSLLLMPNFFVNENGGVSLSKAISNIADEGEVVLQLDPSAREGEDFILVGDGAQVKNRKALKVVPRERNYSVMNIVNHLYHGGRLPYEANSQRRVQLIRRVNEELYLDKSLLQEVKIILKKTNSPELLRFWFTLDMSLSDLDFVNELIETTSRNDIVVDALFARGVGFQEDDLIKKILIKNSETDQVILKNILKLDPDLKKSIKLVDLILDYGNADERILKEVLSKPLLSKAGKFLYPEWLVKIVKHGVVSNPPINYVLSTKPWRDHPYFSYNLAPNGRFTVKEILGHIRNESKPCSLEVGKFLAL